MSERAGVGVAGEGAGGPWLVVIDGQRIFADPASDWGSPMWPDALRVIRSLLPRFTGRTCTCTEQSGHQKPPRE